MYDTQEEFNQKIGNTVVLFDGKPVLVHSFQGSGKSIRITFFKLPLPSTGGTGDPFTEHAIDHRWDFKKLGEKLGYINLTNPSSKELDIVFSSRIPTRHSVQGLNSRTVGLRAFPEGKFHMEWPRLLTQESFVDTITNKFPSKQEAFEMVMNGPSKSNNIAIGRKYALSCNKVLPPVLVYRGEHIAYTEDGKTFKLAQHKQFMKEELVDIEGFNVI